jgi:hypothetical protein
MSFGRRRNVDKLVSILAALLALLILILIGFAIYSVLVTGTIK